MGKLKSSTVDDAQIILKALEKREHSIPELIELLQIKDMSQILAYHRVLRAIQYLEQNGVMLYENDINGKTVAYGICTTEYAWGKI